MVTKHKTVLLQPTITNLQPITEGVYIDATLGGGGHSKELLKYLKTGKLFVFDINPEACKAFQNCIDTEFTNKNVKVMVINDNFINIANYVPKNINGVIADLGFSTDQLDSVKGLSFLKDEDLDMRFDDKLTIKAKDLLNGLYVDKLEKLFIKYGDFSFAKKLSKEIAHARAIKPIQTTFELNALIQKVVPFGLRKGDNKHPEAKVYQALRITINDELNSLSRFLLSGFDLLGLGGKFAVISFHSGEDRIVKNFFRDLVHEKKAKFVAQLIKPDREEIKENNNSRSAHLRVIEKI
jgi:16S rRNA (cytosine1402-N4)-methyltransferase